MLNHFFFSLHEPQKNLLVFLHLFSVPRCVVRPRRLKFPVLSLTFDTVKKKAVNKMVKKKKLYYYSHTVTAADLGCSKKLEPMPSAELRDCTRTVASVSACSLGFPLPAWWMWCTCLCWWWWLDSPFRPGCLDGCLPWLDDKYFPGPVAFPVGNLSGEHDLGERQPALGDRQPGVFMTRWTWSSRMLSGFSSCASRSRAIVWVMSAQREL